MVHLAREVGCETTERQDFNRKDTHSSVESVHDWSRFKMQMGYQAGMIRAMIEMYDTFRQSQRQRMRRWIPRATSHRSGSRLSVQQ